MGWWRGEKKVEKEREEEKEETKSTAGDEVADEAAKGKTARAVASRMTERDRQLLGFLGIARYLTTRQIAEIVFPKRSLDAASKRLHKLMNNGPGEPGERYVRKLLYRSYEGQLVVVWALGNQGHRIAEKALGRAIAVPQRDVGAEFLHHDVTLNDLFVALAKSEREEFSRVDESRFRWTFAEALRLPFSEYDMVAGRSRARLLQPDALLEFPAAKRRYFLECEMGTHSIEARSDEKTGSTLAKIERYSEFMTGFADAAARLTFYERSFPDRWPAALVFLVPTPVRRDHILQAVARWRAGRAGPSIGIRALTLAEAPAEFRDGPEVVDAANPAPGAVDSDLTIRKQELESLWDFFDQAIGGLKNVRAIVRKMNERSGQQHTLPEYPKNSEQVRKLLVRLKPPRQ